MKIQYPTLQEVMAMHEVLVNTFGGSHGVRDFGALESALMRPQLGYYEEVLDQAAALMESLANNHPFIDGNKRVAVFVTDTFLRMNGKYIECENQAAYRHFIQLFERGEFRFEQLRTWLEGHIRALQQVRRLN
jgi:death-on-curing protein